MRIALLIAVFALLTSFYPAFSLPVITANETIPSSPVYPSNYSFRSNWTDDVTNTWWDIANVTFELTRPDGSVANFSASNITEMWYVDLTQDGLGPAGTYTFRWYAVNTSGDGTVTGNTTYTVQKGTTETGLTVNGSASDFTTNVGEPYEIRATLNISETFYVTGNLTSASGSSPITVSGTANMTPGLYNVTAYYPGNENWTSSSATRWVYVFGWAKSLAYRNTSLYVSSGTPVLISCRVLNSNTSQPIPGYYVEIHNGTTNVTAGRTDTNGWFNYTLIVTGSTQEIKCALYTNETHYYNVSSNGTVPLISDFTPPAVTIHSPAGTYSVTSVVLNFSSSDSVSGISGCVYSLDGGPETPTSGFEVFTALGSGTHTVVVTCTDRAGNSRSVSSTFTVSPVPPVRSTVFNPSPERSNVFIPVLYPGQTKSIDIDASGHPVKKVVIRAEETSKYVYITVRRLESNPVSEQPGNFVYGYLEMKEKNLRDSDISVYFALPSSWLSGKDPESVRLERFENGTWTPLPTILVSKGEEYLYRSELPGFSYFAITAKKKEEKVQPEAVPEEEKPPEGPEENRTVPPAEPEAPAPVPVLWVVIAALAAVFAALYWFRRG